MSIELLVIHMDGQFNFVALFLTSSETKYNNIIVIFKYYKQYFCF